MFKAIMRNTHLDLLLDRLAALQLEGQQGLEEQVDILAG